MRKLLYSVLGLAFYCIVPTVATAQHMNEPDAPCRIVTPDASFTACLDVAEKTADFNLNKTYSNISEVLLPADREKLKKSERAWLTYRDAFCDGEYGLYGGGSGGPTAHLACLEAVTRHHEADLKVAYGWFVKKLSSSTRRH